MAHQAPNAAVRNTFESESSLVERLLAHLRSGGSPWGEVEATTEWDYRTGVADVLVRTKGRELVAFEAKLTDWRRASHQAYRSTAYACRAYVVLPAQVAHRVTANAKAFGRFGVGLCAVDTCKIAVLIEASLSEPLLPWLHRRAHTFFDEADGDLAQRPRERRCSDLLSA